MKKQIVLISLLLFLVLPASALTSISTSVIETSYLSLDIWIWLVLFGFGFMILSNMTTPEQNNVLWALIAPFFMFPAAYFASMLQEVTKVSNFNTTSNMTDFSISISVYHIDWLAYLLGLMFIFSFINVLYIATKKPIEKPTQNEL
jgi:hypothetical protein